MNDNKAQKQKLGTDKSGSETARQEGAQSRVGKTPQDKVDDGEIDTSDPKMTSVKY